MPLNRLVWALICSLAAGPLLAAERYSPEQRGRLLAEPAAQSARAKLALARDPARLLPLLNQARAEAAGNPVLGEALLHQGLIRLRDPSNPPDAALRDFVRSLSHYPSQVLVPPADPDHGRRLWVPAYDIAAAARGTLAIWASAANVQHCRAELEAGRLGFLGQPGLPGADLAQALDQAPLHQLRGLAGRSELPAPALAVMAVRLADLGLAQRLLASGDTGLTLRTMDALVAALPTPAALVWLQTASAQPELASAALLAMTRLLPRSTEAQDLLLAQLADPLQGGSAAQALARAATPGIRAALAGIVDTEPDGPRLRRALLALRWIDDPASRYLLQRYADDARTPAPLRDEVASWLR